MINFQTFDLNLLKVLDALLIEGSTVKAGERLGLSQPAISAALNRLRHAMNDPLFVRHGQGLRATDVAKELEAPLRQMLGELEALLAGPERFDPSSIQCSFKLSGSDYFAELLMPKLADHLSRVAPGIRVQLVDLSPDNYLSLLEQTQVDMTLIPAIELPNWADSVPLMTSDFIVVARSGHPRLQQAGLQQGDAIPIDLYCDLGHVLFSSEGKLQGMGDAALMAVGRSRYVAMTLPVFSGVCNAVAESDLIALVPTRLAERVAPRLGLNLYQAPMPVGRARLEMIWHKRSTTNPAHGWLRQQILTLMAPLDAVSRSKI